MKVAGLEEGEPALALRRRGRGRRRPRGRAAPPRRRTPRTSGRPCRSGCRTGSRPARSSARRTRRSRAWPGRSSLFGRSSQAQHEVHDDEPGRDRGEDRDVGEVEVHGSWLSAPLGSRARGRRAASTIASEPPAPRRIPRTRARTRRERHSAAAGPGRGAPGRSRRRHAARPIGPRVGVPSRARPRRSSPMHVGRLASGHSRRSCRRGRHGSSCLGLPGRVGRGRAPAARRRARGRGLAGRGLRRAHRARAPHDGTDTLYVLEQPGILKRIAEVARRGRGAPARDGRWTSTATGKVHAQGQGGALGLAFHPQFKANGRFFVSYLHEERSTRRSSSSWSCPSSACSNGTASPATERVRPRGARRPRAIHQAGGIAFGPDGKLYIGVGDNGSEGRPHDADGQRPEPGRRCWARSCASTWTTRRRARPTASPPNNPWAKAQGVRPEIWAYGFRNPWRFSWDAQGNDVRSASRARRARSAASGSPQVVRGGNHGWPFMEGNTRNPDRRRHAARDASSIPRAFDYGREDPDVGLLRDRRAGLPRRPPEGRCRASTSSATTSSARSTRSTSPSRASRWAGSNWRKIGDDQGRLDRHRRPGRALLLRQREGRPRAARS